LDLLLFSELIGSFNFQLKQTRTTVEVEAKGKIYEQAVHEFDKQACKMLTACENVPQDKLAHQREFLGVGSI
jgi:hypothetical protein